MLKTMMFATFAAMLQAGSALADMALTSPDLADGGALKLDQVLDGFGCKGGNVSPALSWSGAPKGTRSFALTVYDPDAPTGSGWWHWTVFNLAADVTSLPAGASGHPALLKGAVEGRTDFGKPGFGGACPPPGKPHRYIFTLHALKVDAVPVDADASAAMLGYMLKANTIAEARLTAYYGR